MKKQDYLKGLDYHHPDYRPFPFVQCALGVLILAIIAVGFKMCTDQPSPVTIEQLNSRRND